MNMILYGECGVGKTSLRNRWVDGVFTGDVAPTFGVDFNVKTLELVQEDDDEGDGEGDVDELKRKQGVHEQKINSTESSRAAERNSRPAVREEFQAKINVYDTSGKTGYRDVNSTYLLAFDAVLFVYDISAVSSLDVSASYAYISLRYHQNNMSVYEIEPSLSTLDRKLELGHVNMASCHWCTCKVLSLLQHDQDVPMNRVSWLRKAMC